VTATAGIEDGDVVRLKVERSPPRGRLFRKYVVLFIIVVSTALAASGLLEIWFSYREQIASLARLQREQGAAAAYKIGQFIESIEDQVGWTTQLPWSAESVEQRRFDALRLLRQVPAITELRQIDAEGREQLHVSRLALDVIGSQEDFSQNEFFLGAMAEQTFFGPVYFRRESEPYVTMAQSGSRRDVGVAIAEVNLKFIWDLVSAIEVGDSGYAYVVDDLGRLIAHPDISMVLRNTSLADLPQVQAVLNGEPNQEALVGEGPDGSEVISASAPIARLGWRVFVELPVREALAPIYASALRTGGLLLLGLAVAFVAGLFLARRMIVPIKALQEGAGRIGSGDLSRRIDVKTRDEFEALAADFNHMADQLQRSHADLEHRVEERTEALGRSVAELRALGVKLEAASQHKSQFLANMSHELRTPLNAVLGYTELMLDGIYGPMPQKAREVLERVQFNGRHLLGLINNVLDLSKIEAGQIVLNIEPYDMTSLVHAAVESVESLVKDKPIELRAVVEPGLPLGRGDAQRLLQVFVNLVGNAIKFTDKGLVEIRAARDAGSFVLSVRDSGPGIDPADHARIFEEFQQVDNSITRRKPGTGLGLAVSKSIVEMHGGTIRVDSALGEGATFVVTLPVDVEPKAVAA
jgi:signal transduction histidine kinase